MQVPIDKTETMTIEDLRMGGTEIDVTIMAKIGKYEKDGLGFHIQVISDKEGSMGYGYGATISEAQATLAKTLNYWFEGMSGIARGRDYNRVMEMAGNILGSLMSNFGKI